MKMSENPENKQTKKSVLEPHIFHWQTDDSWFRDYCLLPILNMPLTLQMFPDIMFIAVTTVIKHRPTLDKKKLYCALPKQCTSLMKI